MSLRIHMKLAHLPWFWALEFLMFLFLYEIMFPILDIWLLCIFPIPFWCSSKVLMTPADLMLAIVHVLPPFEATCVHRGYLKGEKSPGELNCAPSEFSMLLDTNNNGLISFAVFCMYAYAWRQAHYLYVMLIKLLKHLLILHFVITGILFLLHHLTYQNQVFQLPSKCLILTMMGRFDVYVSVINLHKLLDVPHTILLKG